MKWTVLTLLLLLVLAASWSCHRQSAAPVMSKRAAPVMAKQAAPAMTPAADDQVHTIELPRYQAVLPQAPGREVFAAACLTCHSPRYITMQPPMTAAQWDTAVHKMMKAYAAPIAEDQVPVIVQYLMATKEKGVTAAWSARTASSWHSQPFSAPSLSTDKAQLARDIEHGAAIYKTGCYACHGATGHGDGVSVSDQLPRPTDFTIAAYTPSALASAIVYGVPGTSMPAIPLPDDDMRAIVAYTSQFTAPAHQVTMTGPLLSQAKTLYIQNCAQCHADSGDGMGPLSETQPRPPANFHTKQPSADYAAKAIADGIPGSTMPQWKSKLSAEQRQLLVDYVRTFYTPPVSNN